MTFGHPASGNPHACQLEQQTKKFIPEIQHFTRDIMDDLLRVAQVVLRGLALALGQPEDFFAKVWACTSEAVELTLSFLASTLIIVLLNAPFRVVTGTLWLQLKRELE